jgi:hypothetical protein
VAGEREAGAVGDGEAADPSPPPQSPPESPPQSPAEPPPPPPQRGWYPVPGNPNYQHFWDGQKWGTQRYWGGAGGTDPGAPAGVLGASGLPGPDPFAASRTPSFDAPVQYRGFTGAPFNPRSPARQIAVAAITIVVFLVYFSLHIFPWRVLAIFLVLGLLATALELPARLRFLRNPVRRAAIREPILFQAKVWLRFRYAPTWWPYSPVTRWDMAVRTDTFQVTNWIWGSRDQSRSTFFLASEAVMWREMVEGRDCIVVSGPTYNRSKVEFTFSADGGNPAAWDALARAGVRVVSGPDHPDPAHLGAPGSGETNPGVASPDPVDPAASPRPRGFGRVGSDLGSARAATSQPPSRSPSASVPSAGANATGRAGSGGFGGKRRAPIRARRWSPAFIVAAVLVVFVAPLLLATLVRATDARTDAQPVVLTTECMHQPNSTTVIWSGSVPRTSTLVARGNVTVLVQTVSPNRTVVTSTQDVLPIPANAPLVVPLGPVTITLPAVAATDEVSCQAFLPSTGGR